MEIVPYGGWQRCARFVFGERELIVTLEVGPRIIRYGFVDGPNELVEYPKDMGKTGGDEYHSYGGHRLWIAPEEDPKTLHPDNEAVEHTTDGDWHVFTARPETWFLQKEIRLRVVAEKVELEHRIYNRGAYSVTLAPWALTVMAAGGICLFPQSEFKPHEEKVLPARPLVLWHYTDMQDPRWTWGRQVVRLRHDPAGRPQKCGALVEQGWAAYANHGNLFLKRFENQEGKCYPDFGCNFETFTRHDMLEVESLGPLQAVEPGAFTSHREAWYLVRNVIVPEDDAECAAMLNELAESRPL